MFFFLWGNGFYFLCGYSFLSDLLFADLLRAQAILDNDAPAVQKILDDRTPA